MTAHTGGSSAQVVAGACVPLKQKESGETSNPLKRVLESSQEPVTQAAKGQCVCQLGTRERWQSLQSLLRALRRKSM